MEHFPRKEPLLQGTAINKSFGALRVLRGVEFAIARGEAVGIVGPNGAGKTTLFNVLAGATPPSVGKVMFAGAEITGMAMARRCRLGIARTHQVPRPFLGMTLFENVLVAATQGAGLSGEAAEREALDALDICDLARLASRPAASLGLLDRKRLELARALATQPRILLLDEIGGGLTEEEMKVLVGIIRELKAKGITLVWIEHILHALLSVIDRLVCMSAGAVIADGAPETVMADSEVRGAYLGSGTA